MFEYELTVAPVPDPATPDVDKTFYWHGKASTNYFKASIGPLLGDFGAVNNRNIDLVRIAAAVLAADRSASRSGSLSRWNQRDISLTVDVLAMTPWNDVRIDLERLLGFLTGDIWHFAFQRRTGNPEQIGTIGIDAKRVVLLSGGADSAAGALLSARELATRDEKQILVSHWASPTLSPLQTRIAKEIERLAPGTQADHVKVHLARGRRSPSGTSYGRENSSRSRSFLFIALGLAVASVNKIPLWIPENGYASINPPLSRSRRGSLSTKTTHPKFLGDLISLLDSVGAHSDLVNPYANITKGEMFAQVRDAFGVEVASAFLSETSSCSHTGAKTYGISPKVACGVCFGCVLRRASFAASGVADTTTYLVPSGAKQTAWVADKSVIPAMRDFLREPFGESDLARLQLPSGVSLAEVNELCRRGREELRSLSL
ncbi:hypothetical protein [Haematomicrobium sanguinis]|uniref:hypothetical protein n=1 Tax=Haematomicrobium sanguinis TaxID=479106 RepID=UPI00047EC75F|nr:hypothetical protein [Haematomicrobium sanguinis]